MEQPEIKGKKYFWSGLITGLLVALLLICGAYIGREFAAGKAIQSAKTTAADGTEKESVANEMTMQKMRVLQETIDQYYVDEVDAATLEEGAYSGILKSLEDPYSTYYSAEKWEEIKNQTEGVYFGIGAFIGMDTEVGMARISGVIEATPAEESGILAGDYIYKVGDAYAKGMELEDVIALVKGPEGTKVELTILREKEVDPLEIEVERRKIESPTVNHKTFDNGISYIQITEFDEVTLDQFTEALAVEKETGMKGLIIDLRDNLGGSLATVTEIARQILPKGLIVYTEDKYGKRVEYSCDGKRELMIPIVVLVNGNSASASEILAGAVKDHKKGTLLGTTTFGKGIVQRFISLSDGTVVKLTVSSYFTPNGNNIHKVGIAPDEELKLDVEKYLEKGYDNQLERAKEIIAEQIE